MHINEALVYIRTLCMRAANALARLCLCAGSSEHWLLADAINTKTSSARAGEN